MICVPSLSEKWTHWHKVIDLLDYKHIVIDAFALLITIYQEDSLDALYAGDFVTFGSRVREFIAKLRSYSLEPIFVIDGNVHTEKWDEIMSRAVKSQETVYDELHQLSMENTNERAIPGETPGFCYSIRFWVIIAKVFADVCRSEKAECHEAKGDADALVSIYANKYKCLLVSNDSDFYIFELNAPAYYCNFEDFWDTIDNLPESNFTKMLVFDQFKFTDYYKIDKRSLVVLSLLLGNDFIDGRPEFVNNVEISIKEIKNIEKTKNGYQKLLKKYAKYDENGTTQKFYSLKSPFTTEYSQQQLPDDFEDILKYGYGRAYSLTDDKSQESSWYASEKSEVCAKR